ncbi:MAG: hypothetical protein F8N37_25930 [Telmatospirillum sp.]|nr:hypothetical protein [Telmatospirillum sp.]
MRQIIIFAMAVALAGCGVQTDGRSITSGKPALTSSQPGGEAIVVIGVSVRNPVTAAFGVEFPTYAGWIAVDPATGIRTGDVQLLHTEFCATVTLSYDIGASLSDACRGTEYRAFQVPPGSYALAWLYHGDNGLYSVASFDRIAAMTGAAGRGELQSVRIYGETKLKPTTPRFTVAAGEVLYAGDVIVDFKEPGVSITVSDSVASARSYLAQSGGADVAERMTVRRMTFGKNVR